MIYGSKMVIICPNNIIKAEETLTPRYINIEESHGKLIKSFLALTV